MTPSIIRKVEIVRFAYRVDGLGAADPSGRTLRTSYREGDSITLNASAVAIETRDGIRGEYVLLVNAFAHAQMAYLAPHLLNRDAEQRELIFDDLKRELRQFDHMGHGPLNIALWDLAGKKYGCSVTKLLGGFRTKLAAYASTYHGDRSGGLHCKEAYADFARHCREIGYRAFKIHGWHEGNRYEEAENVLHVAREVGDEMVLMLDPACELRTFADALYVGQACDEAGYFWYEDPFRDAGTSAFAHRRLREMIRTPLLITEHVRGIEPKADFVLAGGTDFVRADPDYDMGITGAMKIARFAEALGLDVEFHGAGPAQRHCIAATRNTNYYEVSLLGPKVKNLVPPVYLGDYSDQLECVDADGNVPVPTGPGLGVTYDWSFINANSVGREVFEA
ncbi:enolase C-terminal domain-like protein [Chelativorans sp.]|uniref:enolase C-terminal domain-like protein n=1 Tax=Chelativorans sp. TaxID=2203393 RepID=UPI002811D6B7|nr:enolase C-terminal domain-like protein [Chelativorans sp.]